MASEAKVKFFDGIADKWDSWEDLQIVAQKLSDGLDAFGIAADETIVDVGCGTGNLTQAILGKLSANGRVVAIDLSSEMVWRAQQKIDDDRVEWRVGDATRMQSNTSSVDRIICFSVWPHFDDPGAAVEEFARILRPGGTLHIWHLSSRETINGIHASAGEAVADDLLVPAEQTAQLLTRRGLSPYEVVDDDTRYLVSSKVVAK